MKTIAPYYCIGFILISISFFGCNNSVKIVVDKVNLHSGKFIIDERQEYNFKESSITIQLKSGKHTVVYNNEPLRTFEVGEDGGLLNLDNQEYVVFEIEYSDPKNTEGVDFNSIRSKAIIMIDSLIIIPKGISSEKTIASLKTILPDLLASKNGNLLFEGWSGGKPIKNGYDTSKMVFGIKQFGKDHLYIEKFWDYDLGADIPKTLEIVKDRRSLGALEKTTTRSAIVRSREFLKLAIIAPELYTVKDISEIRAEE